MNPLFLPAIATEDLTFIGIVVLLVIVAVIAVLWSRKRGKARLEAPAEEAPEALPEAAEEAPAEEAPEVAEEVVPEEKPPLLPEGRTIQQGLERTRTQGFVSRLAGIFRKELDVDIEAKMEEVLLTSDIGVKTAQKLLAAIKTQLDRSQLKDPEAVWALLRAEVEGILAGSDVALGTGPADGPFVLAVVGVNGTGKTTSIGKLASRYRAEGKQVMLVAADTFRAAAVDQLAVWAERSGALFHRGKEQQDPASVAFDGIRQGVEAGVDVVIIDTAGRLHTQKNLVEELKKIVKVCGKAHEGAPHETLLVLDATTGQNAIQQANIFRGEVGVDGIILTKLDGTAKGGVVIGICDMLGIPVRFIGVGEKVEDMRPFSAPDFVDGLFGHSA